MEKSARRLLIGRGLGEPRVDLGARGRKLEEDDPRRPERRSGEGLAL